eukprot:TRINITY_DN1850_c0_g2_i1.p1 TRINITY_DN1850_c0_g2~~TRINITY_DN1850_c0_g2_i1.p1  ORF type:complete len:1343 (-),score=209.14 TRINITY_DN1850_c0_g2_i1:70-3993(-)
MWAKKRGHDRETPLKEKDKYKLPAPKARDVLRAFDTDGQRNISVLLHRAAAHAAGEGGPFSDHECRATPDGGAVAVAWAMLAWWSPSKCIRQICDSSELFVAASAGIADRHQRRGVIRELQESGIARIEEAEKLLARAAIAAAGGTADGKACIKNEAASAGAGGSADTAKGGEVRNADSRNGNALAGAVLEFVRAMLMMERTEWAARTTASEGGCCSERVLGDTGCSAGEAAAAHVDPPEWFQYTSRLLSSSTAVRDQLLALLIPRVSHCTCGQALLSLLADRLLALARAEGDSIIDKSVQKKRSVELLCEMARRLLPVLENACAEHALLSVDSEEAEFQRRIIDACSETLTRMTEAEDVAEICVERLYTSIVPSGAAEVNGSAPSPSTGAPSSTTSSLCACLFTPRLLPHTRSLVRWLLRSVASGDKRASAIGDAVLPLCLACLQSLHDNAMQQHIYVVPRGESNGASGMVPTTSGRAISRLAQHESETALVQAVCAVAAFQLPQHAVRVCEFFNTLLKHTEERFVGKRVWCPSVLSDAFDVLERVMEEKWFTEELKHSAPVQTSLHDHASALARAANAVGAAGSHNASDLVAISADFLLLCCPEEVSLDQWQNIFPEALRTATAEKTIAMLKKVQELASKKTLSDEMLKVESECKRKLRKEFFEARARRRAGDLNLGCTDKAARAPEAHDDAHKRDFHDRCGSHGSSMSGAGAPYYNSAGRYNDGYSRAHDGGHAHVQAVGGARAEPMASAKKTAVEEPTARQRAATVPPEPGWFGKKVKGWFGKKADESHLRPAAGKGSQRVFDGRSEYCKDASGTHYRNSDATRRAKKDPPRRPDAADKRMAPGTVPVRRERNVVDGKVHYVNRGVADRKTSRGPPSEPHHPTRGPGVAAQPHVGPKTDAGRRPEDHKCSERRGSGGDDIKRGAQQADPDRAEGYGKVQTVATKAGAVPDGVGQNRGDAAKDYVGSACGTSGGGHVKQAVDKKVCGPPEAGGITGVEPVAQKGDDARCTMGAGKPAAVAPGATVERSDGKPVDQRNAMGSDRSPTAEECEHRQLPNPQQRADDTDAKTNLQRADDTAAEKCMPAGGNLREQQTPAHAPKESPSIGAHADESTDPRQQEATAAEPTTVNHGVSPESAAHGGGPEEPPSVQVAAEERPTQAEDNVQATQHNPRESFKKKWKDREVEVQTWMNASDCTKIRNASADSSCVRFCALVDLLWDVENTEIAKLGVDESLEKALNELTKKMAGVSRDTTKTVEDLRRMALHECKVDVKVASDAYARKTFNKNVEKLHSKYKKHGEKLQNN